MYIVILIIHSSNYTQHEFDMVFLLSKIEIKIKHANKIYKIILESMESYELILHFLLHISYKRGVPSEAETPTSFKQIVS